MMSKENIHCGRCGAQCRVDGPRNPDAKMLRRSKEAKGLCVNCAVHDWLRNTYPLNIQLAEYGPKGLEHPQIQELFTDIMRANLADAIPDEIDWDKIVENWDLPFPHKMKRDPMNPVSQKELDEIAAGKRPGLGDTYQPKPDPLNGVMTITSLEQLNKLEPGLGEQFGKILREE